MHELQPNGEYAQRNTSPAFPFLPLQELVGFLQPDKKTDETTRMRSFVNWLREQNFKK